MVRAAAALAMLLTLVGVPVVAQDEPADSFDTYCLTIDVPAGMSVDETNVLQDVTALTVVEVVPCGTADEEADTPPGSAPRGNAVAVLDAYNDGVLWNVNIERVNNSAWKAIKKANQFNDKPERGNRYVLLTVRVGHDERGVSYSPNLEWVLWGPDESYEPVSTVLPKGMKSRYEADDIPGGRSTTFGLAFEVPNKVKAADLVLTVTGDEFAELALE